MTGLRAALAYAAQGWPVLPMAPSAKHPLTRHGVHDASTDEAQIRRWWRRWPDANVGMATGTRSGVAVVDVDVRDGGQRSLGALRARGYHLPVTLLAYTGGGGLHLFYRQPPGVAVPNTAGRLPSVAGRLDGIDLRGDGGYVVVAPSIHASGRRYRWCSAPQNRLASLPRWLWPPPPSRTVAVVPHRRRSGASPYGNAALAGEVDTVRRLCVGQRNDGLNRAAFALGGLVAGGELVWDDVYVELFAAALAAGLGEREADRTILSGLRAGVGAPRNAPRPVLACRATATR